MTDPLPVFQAIVNMPGYLPMADEPASFDSACEAWSYLASERERGEDGAEVPLSSDTLALMWRLANPDAVWDTNVDGWWAVSGVGTVYAGTPGYDGEHDLGLAYTVVRHDHKLHCDAYPPAIANPSLPCHACELISMRED
jgi:hypothetical protein